MIKQILILLLLASSAFGQPCVFKQATVTLSDGQIKALPTTPVEILPAPGPGKMIFPIGGIIYFHWSGNYGNIASNSALVVAHANGFNLLTAVFENDGSTSVSNILNDDEDYMAILTPRSNVGIGSQTISRYDYAPNFDNRNITVAAYNGFNGNFTGGDPANTIKVTVYYAIVDL